MTTATIGSTTFVASHRPSSLDLDHRDVDGDVGEVAEGDSGGDLEERGADADEHLRSATADTALGELVVGDGLAVHRGPFVDPFQVRAGVRPDLEALGHQQPGDHLRDRPLCRWCR
ncbi:MAG: hypothetical protein R2705_18205 [Ilumatobacteraceae bacterium]